VWSASRPGRLYPRERPGTHCTGGWVGPEAGLDRCRKSRPTGIRSPDLPARSESLYRLSYPGSPIQGVPDIKWSLHITIRICLVQKVTNEWSYSSTPLPPPPPFLRSAQLINLSDKCASINTKCGPRAALVGAAQHGPWDCIREPRSVKTTRPVLPAARALIMRPAIKQTSGDVSGCHLL
jgi:hypothetical protein